MKPKLSLCLALPVFAGALSAATEIVDPPKFVTDVYDRIVATERRSPGYEPPTDIYTPRLKALFAEDKRHANGEVGCIEFDFWTNAQDWGLRNVRVTSQDVPDHPDRKLVIATFTNLRQPEEIHFDFQKVGGKWLLDDVQSLKKETWTLSKLLKCW
jgi:Protein of unknown function (DUF3828)